MIASTRTSSVQSQREERREKKGKEGKRREKKGKEGKRRESREKVWYLILP
jgi:hypothetical protein